MNTFGTKVKVGVKDDGTPIYHSPHEFNDTMKNVYLKDFLYSVEYEDWQRINGKTIGYSKFREGATMCRCIRAPKDRYCVDKIETGLSEILYALKNKLRATNAPCVGCEFCAAEDEQKGSLGEGNNVDGVVLVNF